MQKDSLHRFLIENTNVRGEWIHLDDTWLSLLSCSEYPDAVKTILGEALAATLLLSATLKYEGRLSLQVNGSGPVTLLLIQATSDGKVRGLAQWKEQPTDNNFSTLFGDGHLTITIEPTDGGERYQGIVDIEAETFSQVLENYFEQSEQLKTRLWFAVDEKSVSAMLLQRMPETDSIDEDAWSRTEQLAQTVTKSELIELDMETLLYRLFNEENVRVFEPQDIKFQCTCSQNKIEEMIVSFGETEALIIIEEQGKIAIDCEFCNHHYEIDKVDLKRLFSDNITQTSETLH